jgi:integrase
MPRYINGLAKVGRVYHFNIWQNGKGFHGSTRCETLAAAKEYLRVFRDTLAVAKVGGQTGWVPTLGEALARWLAATDGQVVAKHRDQVQQHVQLYLADLIDVRLDQVRPEQLQLARAKYLKLPGRGRRPGQGEWDRAHTEGGANKVVGSYRLLHHFAQAQGWVRVDPPRLAKLKVPQVENAIVWPEQVPDFLAAVGKAKHWHARMAIRLMLGLGLREGEALGACWEDVDWRSQTWVVPGDITKNRKSRAIQIPEWLLGFLVVHRHMARTPHGWPHGLILPGPEGEPHRVNYCLKPIQGAGERIKIAGLHPHRLRATFATTHYEAGTTLSQISLMLGHEEESTTLRYIVQRPRQQDAMQADVARRQSLAIGSPHNILTTPLVETRK